MKNSKLTLITILLFTVVNAFTQAYSEFIIIDEIADNVEQLKSDFSSQSNVYVTDGIALNAIQQISTSIGELQIEELHIYVPTKPGAIVFNSIAITTNNMDDWLTDLEALSEKVTNQVVIHSDVVFTGEEGIELKERLEGLTGLVFTTQN
jgi:hypothetical protein